MVTTNNIKSNTETIKINTIKLLDENFIISIITKVDPDKVYWHQEIDNCYENYDGMGIQHSLLDIFSIAPKNCTIFVFEVK